MHQSDVQIVIVRREGKIRALRASDGYVERAEWSYVPLLYEEKEMSRCISRP